MGNISYTIISGIPPFKAELVSSSIPINTHNTVGTFEFNNVPDGGYTLKISDSNDCLFEKDIIVNPYVSTTTTTLPMNNSLIIGNTQDITLIFDINGTNRNTHYVGYPTPDDTILYLWFKTTDGKPLINDITINYSIFSEGTSKFKFIYLSDEINCNVIENTIGLSTNINGQILFKSGFIETFFSYQYVIDEMNPNYQIYLNNVASWLNKTVPIVDDINIYGITYIDDDNSIMKF